MLTRVPRITPALASAIVGRFGDLATLRKAAVVDIADVEGVDDALATSIIETLERITETSILDQFA